jgi:CRP-like cAMP-binding protein
MDRIAPGMTAFISKTVNISKTDAQAITERFTEVKYEKNELLLAEGQMNDDYLYLESGLMRAYLCDLDGNEITIDFFTPNNMVFDVTSFFQRVNSEINIQALTECKGQRISYEASNKLFHSVPAFRDFGRAILVQEFIAQKKRNIAMINQSAEARYENLIQHKPEIFVHSPLKYIASFLGVTDSTLSRIRAKKAIS